MRACQAISAVSLLSSNTVQLRLVEPVNPGEAPSSRGSGPAYVVGAPDDEAEPDPSAVTAPVERPAMVAPTETAPRADRRSGRRLGAAALLACGGLALVLIVGTVLLGGRSGRGRPDQEGPKATGPEAREVGQTPPPAPRVDRVEINIAYGTEKQQWFEAAADEFQKSEAGREISIVLHGMGSMEGPGPSSTGPSRSPSTSGRRPAAPIATPSSGSGGPSTASRRSSRPRTSC